VSGIDDAGIAAQMLMSACEENDNLREEYSELYRDVAKDIPWARIALGQDPDAINLWVGNSRSVTALHKDNYENIYCQVMGAKHFVLLPPVEMACVNEKELPSASYTWSESFVSTLRHCRCTLSPSVGKLTAA
jgi:hypothetical protein